LARPALPCFRAFGDQAVYVFGVHVGVVLRARDGHEEFVLEGLEVELGLVGIGDADAGRSVLAGVREGDDHWALGLLLRGARLLWGGQRVGLLEARGDGLGELAIPRGAHPRLDALENLAQPVRVRALDETSPRYRGRAAVGQFRQKNAVGVQTVELRVGTRGIEHLDGQEAVNARGHELTHRGGVGEVREVHAVFAQDAAQALAVEIDKALRLDERHLEVVAEGAADRFGQFLVEPLPGGDADDGVGRLLLVQRHAGLERPDQHLDCPVHRTGSKGPAGGQEETREGCQAFHGRAPFNFLTRVTVLPLSL